ncbi:MULTISPECIES: VWA domain-containing protein [unclassified Meiothermus]|uniref:VWA domain-containing protein n=1 Tax=unclassified Meiothermus TaxID=370471 RepID=UPI000D7C74E4|nr:MULTISPECIES: VWA domain-containing protein [unclassified Meiothermus]PZA07109.1 hypothetical protein DNA98_10720 [Meiothermus sp. Pnk-1]RYM40008.1 VWA domain-containing protein [Meiothermus sp. PNK-Is4]
MTFTWPTLLWALLLLPVVMGVLVRAEQRRQRTAQVFADSHLLSAVVRQPSPAQARWPRMLYLLALALLLLASARPVAAPPLPTNKAAVVIALDASKSMLASDINPNRLEAARAIAKEFVRLAPPTTKIGLITFSDSASVVVAPTTDRAVLQEALDNVKPVQNTSLPSAIVTGVRLLPGRKEVQPPTELQPQGPQGQPPQTPLIQPDAPPPREFPPGSLLVISDGATNVSSNPRLPNQTALEAAAKFAKDNGVKIYAFAVGKEGGAVMRLEGRDYFVPFEPRSLQQLAERTGGKYVYPPTEEALRAVYRELGTVIRWEATRLEVSSLLSGLAVILMLVGAGLNLRLYRRVP